MSTLFVLLGFVSFIAIFVFLFKKQWKTALYCVLGTLVCLILVGLTAPATADTAKEETKDSQKQETKAPKKERDSFYEINQIKDKYTPGSQTLTMDGYDAMKEKVFTLEGAVTKYGLPTNVTGADEGDKFMEVIYPTDEDGYSVGLVFERTNKSSFGDWTLDKKYVVETKGVTIPEYK